MKKNKPKKYQKKTEKSKSNSKIIKTDIDSGLNIGSNSFKNEDYIEQNNGIDIINIQYNEFKDDYIILYFKNQET